MVLYLHRNGLTEDIDVFIRKVNPSQLPAVVGALLRIGCSDDAIERLVSSPFGQFSIVDLVEQLENHNKLTLLMPWLKSKADEGSTDPAVHNTLAKLYIDCDSNAERFLIENSFYDSKIVGKYCEKRNPHLACVVYERSHCDADLIRVCNENSLFRIEAKYLVSRKDANLWSGVLEESNPFKRQIVDQVVQTILKETSDPEDITATLKAFMVADLPSELVEILERLVLEQTPFSKNRNLQNLLLLTAIKTNRSKVSEYIEKLQNFDAVDIGNMAINHGLYDEAFLTFKKFGENCSAIQVIIDHMDDLSRAAEFAETCNDPAVWSVLAKAQLRQDSVVEAITSFIKAQDQSVHSDVVRKAHEAQAWEPLVNYLQMARKLCKDSFIDGELLYALAKTDRLQIMEEILASSHSADISKIGDRCFAEKMFKAAKLLFDCASNFPRLACTLVQLNDFQNAVDCARKANSIEVLKEVCFACVDHNELRLAHICGVHIALRADELDKLIKYYEDRGCVEEIINLLESTLGMERNHMGIMTQLAILYSKYDPPKMREHLELFWSRVNIPKVIRAAEAAHLWSDIVFLYDRYEEYDNALLLMMEHPSEAWKEGQFKDVIGKVANVELYFKAIQFYVQYKPLLLCDLLSVLSPRLDHARTVKFFSEKNLLPLVKDYLISVQHTDNRAVNESLNFLYVEERNFENLRTSTESYQNFDSLGLAQKLEDHPMAEFKKIAAILYKNNNRWKHSVSLCKRAKLFKDAIAHAAESKQPAIVQELMEWFLVHQNIDCFVACLFQCYDFLRPDFVLEMAWRHGATAVAMPYMINVVQEYVSKVDELVESGRLRREEAERTESESRLLNASSAAMMPICAPAAYPFFYSPVRKLN
ncbi:unnamed protein product [Nesidiocoris tenuis]|uniref:Clathrin heavy chain linker core motif domain-containing protein n=1 Tax=Nesidiocoris tenuis TaxID=355587 RepID=A0A6H5GBI5_9HEMI|nr:unnamed protein product [Nesidiocoris tenuis]